MNQLTVWCAQRIDKSVVGLWLYAAFFAYGFVSDGSGLALAFALSLGVCAVRCTPFRPQEGAPW
jgi:hypothetical protein